MVEHVKSSWDYVKSEKLSEIAFIKATYNNISLEAIAYKNSLFSQSNTLGINNSYNYDHEALLGGAMLLIREMAVPIAKSCTTNPAEQALGQ